MTKIPKILFIARDDGGCGYFRCYQPAQHLKRSGLADAEYILRTPTPEQLLGADLVILQEMGSVNGANLATFCLENKIPFMLEFDDFIQHVSPRNLGGHMAWNPSTLYTHRAMEAARKATAVQVSTPQLAREYFPYNNTIFVIPNYLDKELWDNPPVKRPDGKMRIGWMGGNAHADDLFMVSKVIEKIVKEYKGKVIFETMGMTRQELGGVFKLDIQNEPCIKCGHEGELHHYPGEALQQYPLILASKGWDLAIAPVIDNSFGNCKSDLKIKEYAAAGLPMAASPVVPYREAASNGAQVLLARTFDEWYNAIKELIEDPKKRADIARANREWIGKYWIQDNAKAMFEVYRQVIVKSGKQV